MSVNRTPNDIPDNYPGLVGPETGSWTVIVFRAIILWLRQLKSAVASAEGTVVVEAWDFTGETTFTVTHTSGVQPKVYCVINDELSQEFKTEYPATDQVTITFDSAQTGRVYIESMGKNVETVGTI